VPTSFGKMGELDVAAEDWNAEADATSFKIALTQA